MQLGIFEGRGLLNTKGSTKHLINRFYIKIISGRFRNKSIICEGSEYHYFHVLPRLQAGLLNKNTINSFKILQ